MAAARVAVNSLEEDAKNIDIEKSASEENRTKNSTKNGNMSDNEEISSSSETEQRIVEKKKIFVMPRKSEELKIVVSESVNDVRPFLLCCVFKNVRFADSTVLKNFLTLQSKMHKVECKKRVAATIATHDLDKIRHPLKYLAKIPQEISIHPLGKHKLVTAEEFVEDLVEEAEKLRKEKKRNASGIHQYLHLVKDKSKYPCLIDSENRVVSLYPLTNCEYTKISVETRNILVEVSSSQNLATCKRVMESLIESSLDLNLNNSTLYKEETTGEVVRKTLTLEQVHIFDEQDYLMVSYPSLLDLQLEHVDVIKMNADINEN